jgi:uncharacterized cofD-like protein
VSGSREAFFRGRRRRACPLGFFLAKEVRKMKRKKITVIGGGTGPTAILRGLVQLGGRKRFEINSIVTVSDSGGSSGMLRDELGVLPPGDLLKSLVALSPKVYARELLQFRFTEGNGLPRLAGHTFGNLSMVMFGLRTGNDLEAVLAMEQLLDCHGHVLPVSLNKRVELVAETNRRFIVGEGKIEEWIYAEKKVGLREQLRRVFLKPQPQILPEAMQAIRSADLIAIAPGSFYTSLMAVLGVKGMVAALRHKRLAYVVNITTHPKETPRWKASDFVTHLEAAIGRQVNFVLCNTALPTKLKEKYRAEKSRTVEVDIPATWNGRFVIGARFVPEGAQLARHDPNLLASIIASLE